MIDVLGRLTAHNGFNWILRGSLALPARPTARTAAPHAVVADVYQTARLAFDIDLCATTVPHGDPDDAMDAGDVLFQAAERIIATSRHVAAYHGVGLGGLVHYSRPMSASTPGTGSKLSSATGRSAAWSSHTGAGCWRRGTGTRDVSALWYRPASMLASST